MKKFNYILGTAICAATVLFVTGNVDVHADSKTDSSVISESDYDDPEYWKYHGQVDNGFYDNSEYEAYVNVNYSLRVASLDTAIVRAQVPYSDTTKSPFTGKTIKHNDKFKDCNILDGIDVSKWQGEINWEKAKAAGVDFTIIRAGYRSSSATGTLNTDPYYKQNMENAKAADIDYIGVYMFSQAITTAEAIEEADYVLNLVKGYDINLPIVFDTEYVSGGRLTSKVNKDELTSICEAFCERIIKAGYTPMIYSNKDFLYNKLYGDELGESYDIWLANYLKEPFDAHVTTYDGEYDYWQYYSQGKVDGISGNVDCNVWYKGDIPATDIKLDVTSKTLKAGDTLTLKATVSPSNATDEVKWYSSNPAVAYINSDGKITAVSKGTTVITAKATGGKMETCTIKVNESLSGFTVADISDIAYTGKNITRNLTVKSKEKVVKSGTVTADSLNIRKGPSTSYGIVTYMEKGTNFNVSATIVSGNSVWYAVNLKDSEGNVYYGYASGGSDGTGSQYESVSKGYRNLTITKQYTTTYAANKNVGTAIVKVTGVGKGTYTGSISKTFKIVPQAVEGLKKESSSKTSIKISWSKLYYASGYYVYRSTAVDGTYNRIAKVSKSTLTYKDTNLDAYTGYYYKVKAYKTIDGITYNGAASQYRLCCTNKEGKRYGEVTSQTYIRKGPESSNAKVYLMPAKAKPTVYVMIKDKVGNKWYKVSYTYKGKTYTGYALGSKLTVTMKGTVNASSLNVRSGAGTSYSSIGSIARNKTVTIYGTTNGWYKINVTVSGKVKTGYVKASYIKLK